MNKDDIQLGKPYVFQWVNAKELTGIAIRKSGGYITLRTKTNAFTVFAQDVIREAQLKA